MVKQKAKVVTLPRRARSGKDTLSQLDELAQRLTAAVNTGAPTLFAEAEQALAALARASSAQIIVNIGGFWHRWRDSDEPDAAIIATDELPRDAHQLSQPAFHGESIFLPIRPGGLGALIAGAKCGSDSFTALHIAAGCIDLALTTCEQSDPAARRPHELQDIYTAAARILRASNADALLLALTQEAKRLLASDMSGAMLHDGDEVVMRHCVGQFSVDTATLRREGVEDVAARVLETLETLLVGDVFRGGGSGAELSSRSGPEGKRAVLTVPILARGDIAGVLEVWRRRSAGYSGDDRVRLVALAALASLALDNQPRKKIAADLASAGLDLDAEGATVRQATRFQQSLISLLLVRSDLNAFALETARKCNARVVILNGDLEPEAAYPDTGRPAPSLVEAARRLVSRQSAPDGELLVHPSPAKTVSVQCVVVRGEILGCIVCETELPLNELHRLDLGQIANTLAYHFMEQRESERARTEAIQAVLWDVLEGSEAQRSAAVARADALEIPTEGDKCVVLCQIDGLEESALVEAGDGDAVALHTQLIETARASQLGSMAQAMGLRGRELRIVGPSVEKAQLLELVEALVASIRRDLPPLRVHVGISGPGHDVRSLATALREAKIALEVAQHQTDGVATHYSDVGLLGLLINLRTAADMRRVSGEILGDLLTEPDASRRTLIDTLTAFFAANCSQMGAAATLGIHQKTIAYRLAKISRLTGLDLSKHQDRLLIDLAVRVFSIININQRDAGQ